MSASILPYKDASTPIPIRVKDLISRMTLAEKAGQLFHNMITMGPNGTLAPANPAFDLPSTETLLLTKQMTHFNLLGVVSDAKQTAQWHNALQELAITKTRLGIPITISTDPRNHLTNNPGTGFGAGVFSQWPESLGFAALRDEALVEKFGDMARQEYLAVGLRLALHPQVDLATEYRWARIGLTFGESAEVSGKLGAAWVRGFQGVNKTESVSCMTKHFPGGGPQKDGEDPHFVYGREQVYDGGCFEYHLKPFEELIGAGTRWIMPYYGMPVGVEGVEEVGFAFNKDVIQGILRDRLEYRGIVCTDWGLVSDGVTILGQDMPARAWGCEDLSELERVRKILDAGCDQFGGESRPELVVEAVEKGLVSEERIDQSVSLILKEKFEMGLFDNPYVDVDAAASIVGRDEFVKAGEDTQRRSFTLLKNESDVLPLSLDDIRSRKLKVYAENISIEVLESFGLEHTAGYQNADIAFLRLNAPYEPRPGGFESFFHAGSLEYPQSELDRLKDIFSTVETCIVDVYLDRPGVLTPIIGDVNALMVNYASTTAAFMDVVFGTKPEGKLPFDLPRSMEAVRSSKEDIPFDTEDALFRFGFGLEYTR